ncbi:MAG TPA: glycerophosphoryl diester phosphodiesterase membrane domain-containing protein [Acidothermaceae bacterium]
MDDTPGWVDPTPPADSGPPQPPPPPAPPAQPPPAWQYFTSPAPPPQGVGSSWGPPQYGPPQYGPPQSGSPQFGPPQYGPPQYGPPQYGPPQYQPPPYGQYVPAWGGYQEYKPGVVPLRPLSVGEVLDGSFSTIRKHPRIVFGGAAVLAVVAELIRLLVGLALNNVPASLGSTSFSTNTDNTNGDTTANFSSIGSTATGAVVSLVVNALCVAVLAGVVTGVVGKAVIGQQPNGREILGAVRKRWFGLLVVSVLAEVLPFTPILLLVFGILLGTISTGAGVAGGVFGGLAALVLCPLLWGRLALAVPIFILERKGPGASIARSWRLVRGAFWRTWLLRALVWIIVVVAGGTVSAPLFLIVFSSAASGKTPSTLDLIIAVIIGALVWMVTQPLTAAALTIIYVDRRMRAEGLDLQLVQAARAAATPTPARA